MILTTSKKVNDTYGHIKGDDILKFLTDTIQTRLRKSDVFIRYGGEEFLVLLPNTDVNGGFDIAKKLNQLFREHVYSDEQHTIPITISIGVSQHTDEINFRDIIHKADIALYDAKNNGRNRVECYR